MGGAVQGDAAGDSIYRAVLGFPGRGMDGGQTMASAPKGTRRSFGGGGASSVRERTGRCREARVRQPRRKKRLQGRRLTRGTHLAVTQGRGRWEVGFSGPKGECRPAGQTGGENWGCADEL
jgi:hypothetical protein